MTGISHEDDDEIMTELRRIREEIYAEFGDDFEAYSAHLREVEKRDRARGAVYVTFPPRAGRTRHDAA